MTARPRTRRASARAASASLRPIGLAIALAACAPGLDSVPFRVVPVGGDPFLGADRITLHVSSSDGRELVGVELPPDTRDFGIGPLAYDEGLVLGLETGLDTLSLARGRSFPFAVSPAGLVGSADVTLGVLGRHAHVLDLPDLATSLAATNVGALVATRTHLVPFLAHGPDGRPALGLRVPLPAARVGATFAPLDGGLLAVGGADAGATLFAADGTVLAELAADALPIVSEVALAPLGPTAVLLVGGLDVAGALTDGVTRLESEGGVLSVVALEPLAAPRAGARALALSATSSSGAVPRVLVDGGRGPGGPADELVVLDPSGAAGAVVFLPPVVVHGAALAAVETGQLMLAGGRALDGAVTDEVRVLFVDAERPPAFLSPPPPRLFRARVGALALGFAPGVVLVLGGADAAGDATDATELADLRALPGRVFLTGSLPAPALTSAAAHLLDGTILVASGASLSLYFPPLP